MTIYILIIFENTVHRLKVISLGKKKFIGLDEWHFILFCPMSPSHQMYYLPNCYLPSHCLLQLFLQDWCYRHPCYQLPPFLALRWRCLLVIIILDILTDIAHIACSAFSYIFLFSFFYQMNACPQINFLFINGQCEMKEVIFFNDDLVFWS